MFKNTTKSLTYLSVLLVLLAIPFLKANAAFITPSILTIDPGQMSGEIILKNLKKKSVVLKFSWEQKVMREDGTFENYKEGVSPSTYRPADTFVSFSPQRVILKPGQIQNVRFFVKRNANMQDGEYHSHFAILEEPLVTNEDNNMAQRSIGGKIVLKTNTLIPILVRHGTTNIDFKFEKAAIINENGATYLDTRIANNSTRSIYGNYHLICKTEDKVRNYRIAPFRVYHERKIAEKKISLEGVDLNGCQSLTTSVLVYNDYEYNNQYLGKTAIQRTP